MEKISTGLDFTEQLVFAKTGKSLSDVQRVVLHSSWYEQRKTYDQIAQEFGYSATYIKQIVAPKLWKLLSGVLGEKVNKNNFRAAIERRRINKVSSSSQKLIQKLRCKLNSSTGEDNNSVNNSEVKSKLTETNNLAIKTPATNLEEVEINLSSSDTKKFPELEQPQGKVPLASPFYIERVPCEVKCYQEIEKLGAFIHIKAPKQMGKSSLLGRIIAHGENQGYRTAQLNLQQVDRSILSNLEKFLRWLAFNVTFGLKLQPKLDIYWHEDLGSKASCTLYFQEYLLPKIESPLVLALDEVNEIFAHPHVAQDFLPLLRSWYEEAKDNPLWQKLRLVVVNSTEVYVPLQINFSPFRIGLSMELRSFNWQEVQELSHRHKISLSTEDLAQLMWLVAGHPYLIRVAFYHLAQQDLTLEELMKTAASDTGIYSRHLQQQCWYLQQNPELMTAFEKVLQAKAPIELGQVAAFKLNSVGLVNIQDNYVMTSCYLYQRYFGENKYLTT